MTVTIIFKGGFNHKGQVFENVTDLVAHNTYHFLELVHDDGSVQQFNFVDIFSYAYTPDLAAKKS